MSSQTANSNLTVPARDTRNSPTSFYLAAGFDALLGFDLIVFSGPIAAAALPETPALFGLETATILQILGILLVVFAAETVFLARTKSRFARLLPAIVWCEWAWVAASVAIGIVAFAAFSTVALVVIAIVAFATAELALFQHKWLRRNRP